MRLTLAFHAALAAFSSTATTTVDAKKHQIRGGTGTGTATRRRSVMEEGATEAPVETTEVVKQWVKEVEPTVGAIEFTTEAAQETTEASGPEPSSGTAMPGGGEEGGEHDPYEDEAPTEEQYIEGVMLDPLMTEGIDMFMDYNETTPEELLAMEGYGMGEGDPSGTEMGGYEMEGYMSHMVDEDGGLVEMTDPYPEMLDAEYMGDGTTPTNDEALPEYYEGTPPEEEGEFPLIHVESTMPAYGIDIGAEVMDGNSTILAEEVEYGELIEEDMEQQ